MKRNLYIFCGGKSLRMGEDKALLSLGNKTFLESISSRAKLLFQEVILLSAHNRYDISLRQFPDALNDAGPLGGLLAALRDAHPKSHNLAILPVDLPKITDHTLEQLAVMEPHPGNQAVILRSGDLIQPLAGVYQTGISKQLKEYLDRGERRVMGFLRELNHEHLDVHSEEIRNVNTPEDYNKL